METIPGRDSNFLRRESGPRDLDYERDGSEKRDGQARQPSTDGPPDTATPARPGGCLHSRSETPKGCEILSLTKRKGNEWFGIEMSSIDILVLISLAIFSSKAVLLASAYQLCSR